MFSMRRMLTVLLVLSSAAVAQTQFKPFVGIVTSDDVYVRSGASKNYYDTGKVQSGTIVQVTDLLYGWYAINPPSGSFSYISQDFVKPDADGKTGTVTGDNVRVRAPAAGGPSRSYKIQTKLDKDAKVAVIGSEDGYYKIVPPAGVVLYVAQDYVKPAPPGAVPDQPTTAPQPMTGSSTETTTTTTEPATTTESTTPTTTETTTPATTTTTETATTEATTPTTTTEATTTTTTTPATTTETTTPATTTEATTPTTTETTTTAQAPPAAPPVTSTQLLAQAEARYVAADAQPLADQPIDDLLGAYRALADAKDLTDQQKALIDARIDILTSRLDVQQELAKVSAETKKMQEVKAALPKNYIAVGKLVTSTVYTGEQQAPLMYRLVDPLTGMSICYVEPLKGKNMQALLGQTVGILGRSRYDTGLAIKVVQPTDIDILTAQSAPAE